MKQIIKYLIVFILPITLLGQAPCAKDSYYSFWDKKNGPMIGGKKATYHYFEIPWDKITKQGGKNFLILHPNFTNECEEDVLVLKDTSGILTNAEDGDKYNIAVVMMYLNGVATKISVCPSYPPPHP